MADVTPKGLLRPMCRSHIWTQASFGFISTSNKLPYLTHSDSNTDKCGGNQIAVLTFQHWFLPFWKVIAAIGLTSVGCLMRRHYWLYSSSFKKGNVLLFLHCWSSLWITPTIFTVSTLNGYSAVISHIFKILIRHKSLSNFISISTADSTQITCLICIFF